MKILVFALLKPSQIKYKIVPLSLSDQVNEIIIVRKYPEPEIEKVKYLLLPKICKYKVFNLLLTPFILLFWAHKLKPDLLLSYHFIPHGFFAYIVSFFTRTPFIYSQIDLDIQRLAKIPLVGFLIRKIIKQAMQINVPGSFSKNFWIQQGLDSSKINLIHSTIDTEKDFYPMSKSKDFDFIYIGVLDKNKQVDLIIKSFANLVLKFPNYNLCIIGEGNKKQYLQKLVDELNLNSNITFLGKKHEIADYLNRSRVFVMASKTEGLPCALLEAMSCELLPVATNVGNIPDLIEDGFTGFLVNSMSVDELSFKMELAINNYNSHSMMMKNARQMIVSEHSYISATKKWDNLLSSFLS
jgi:glycosyltransferase involved in cell wall biosynthesis